MLREQNLARRNAQVRRDQPAHPDLLTERVLHRLWKRAPGTRKGPKGTRQNAIELQHRTLVENHRIQRLGADTGVIQAPLDRCQRERGVILAARKALLLNRCDRYAIDDERRRRIVIVRGDSENLHLSIAFRVKPGAAQRGRTSRESPAWRRL